VPLKTTRTAYGAAALEVLRAAVGEVKHDDPMAPVTIVVPNNLAAIVARRHLAATGVTSSATSGIAGISLATAERLAESLAAPALAPRRPATAALVAAAWRSALRGEPGVFERVHDHPATIRALVAAHTELRDLSERALDAVAAATSLASDLVRLHRQVTALLADDWYDATTLLSTATDVLRQSDSAVESLGHVLLYLPQALTLHEAAFLAALTTSAEATALVGVTDVDRADRVVRRSLDRIGHPLAGDKGKARVGHEVIHASDSDDEVRCVVRDVVATLRHTPAHRVAVLYGSAAPYARLLHEHLAATGITTNGPGTRAVVERSLGRGFLDVLSLAASDLPRAALFLAISEAPTRTFDGGRVPTARWERLSRSAAVVGGDDWSARLTTHLESLERARADLERERPEFFESADERLRREIESATQFRAFAVTLRDRLRAGLTLTSWSELSGWASSLFRDLYGDDRALAQLPAEEQYAAVAIESTLRGLADLGAVEPRAELAGLIEVLTLALESALPRIGRFGEGVLVAPLSAAIGLEADVVYVVGLAEDTYPGRLREDALLLEQVRDATGGELASYRDRLDAKHRQLLAAFDAAPRVVASFPRGDLRRSTGRLPSRWLLPTLRELAGDRTLAATAWETITSDHLRGSRSYASSLTTAALPATEQEWRTQAILAGVAPPDETVDRADELLRARASDAFTRFDGNLERAAGLPDFRSGGLVSPTALETYARCPHAYFVERLLRVTQLEQPEEIITISPLEVGNLIHETMDEFVTSCGDTLPTYGAPWTPAHRDRLHEIATAKALEFERRGATGHARLWETELARIHGDLDYLLDDDDRRRADRDSRVVRSELAFGQRNEPAVEIAGPGGRVRMRGSADLVEEASDGTLIVIDIKTGGFSSYKDIETDPVMAGTRLQLPVYAAAARQLLGGERAEAAYWFVRQGKRRWIEVELSESLTEVYADTIGRLVSAIASGLFPAKAPEGPDFSWVQCDFCNPDGLGHGEVRSRWERKRHAPVLRELVELVDPGVVATEAGGAA
jgi:RecB family exonuclease